MKVINKLKQILYRWKMRRSMKRFDEQIKAVIKSVSPMEEMLEDLRDIRRELNKSSRDYLVDNCNDN